MEKSDYRTLFKDWQVVIKFNPIIRELGMYQPNFSNFMSGEDQRLSIDDLERLKLAVIRRVKKIA